METAALLKMAILKDQMAAVVDAKEENLPSKVASLRKVIGSIK